MRSLLSRLVLVGLMLGAYYACSVLYAVDGGPGWRSDVRIPTHQGALVAADEFTGSMSRRDGCVIVTDPIGNRVLPIWPTGFSYQGWERGGALYDSTRANVIVEAETITLIGQLVFAGDPVPSLARDVSPDCAAFAKWLVARVGVPPQ
jgi:hypothetical protein